MSDKVIITQNELNYIETLYLYANLEDFIDSVQYPDIDGYGSYILMMQWVTDTILCNANLIGSTSSKTIYELPNFRLLISDYDVAKRSNTFNIEIQYTQEHLFNIRDDILGLELPFGGTHDQYFIKRVDVTKVAKHEEDYLSNKSFISTYKTFDYKGTTAKTETVYLGHRKNGNVLRMYNKTIELMTDTPKHPINYKKISLFSAYFGDIENLYTYELELHRKVLKSVLGIDKLSDILKVKDVYNSIVGRVRIYDNTEHNRKLVKQKNPSRIQAYKITSYTPYIRENSVRYKPSLDYLKRSVNKQIDNYIKSMEIEDTDHERLKIYNFIMSDQMAKKGYDIVMEYVETDDYIEYEEMKEKHERLRDGNDELQSESIRAFREVKKRDRREDNELHEEHTKGATTTGQTRDTELFSQGSWEFSEVCKESITFVVKSEAISSNLT